MGNKCVFNDDVKINVLKEFSKEAKKDSKKVVEETNRKKKSKKNGK